ncbi:hypothetical protein ABEB36_011099 [Hypothenemus hampei]|uniref:Uncharacterized protein n=1 Tax=Hypothenemus hampei TaxID=57062 RepID=A0ABD1EE65_HYPHA
MEFQIYYLTLMVVLGMASAQRPTYAGSSPKGYPDLGNRFRNPDEDDGVSVEVEVGLENRIGESDDGSTQKIPADARGDAVLVNRLNQWPREHRPFWLLNSDHLDKHRNANVQKNLNQRVTQNRIRINLENATFEKPLGQLTTLTA